MCARGSEEDRLHCWRGLEGLPSHRNRNLNWARLQRPREKERERARGRRHRVSLLYSSVTEGQGLVWLALVGVQEVAASSRRGYTDRSVRMRPREGSQN